MILIFRRLFARGSVFLREQQLPSHTQRHCLSSTVDQAEIDHFNRLSSSSLKPNNNNDDDAAEPCACDAPGGVWWDASGPLKTLHHVNTSRMAYARNWITRHFAKDSTSERNSELPLSLSLLDVGCGGGLATEALYRMGERAEHTWRTQASSGDSFELKGGTDRCAKGWRCVGVDAAEAGIAAAKDHFARAYCNQLVCSDAVKAGSSLEYRLGHLPDVLEKGEQFDVVTAFEVLEHVSDVDAFLRHCIDAMNPSGLLFLSTFNRTPSSLLLGIIAAEYLLCVVPRGTHDWRRFIAPEQLQAIARDFGCSVMDVQGVSYNPFKQEATLTHDTSIQYLMVLRKESVS